MASTSASFQTLTDQDLKDIGVLLGHRRKILRAIAELGNAPDGASAPPPPKPASTPAAAPPPTTFAAEAAGCQGTRREPLALVFLRLTVAFGSAVRVDDQSLRLSFNARDMGIDEASVVNRLARFEVFPNRFDE
jgi:hypothetical protein